MKISKQQAQAMGLDVPASKRKRAQTKPVDPELFCRLCQAHGLPRPVAEFEFHPDRKWRFDFAWIYVNEGFLKRLALEIQGGLFVGGRHVRGAALLKEHEKLNEAACLGWRVIFCTPADVKSGAVFALIKRALNG